MKIGISSSCFYPLETEKSLIRLGEMGVKDAEVFFNSPSELQGGLFREICRIKEHYGINVVSFHPFMSFAEGYYLFSNYARRFEDSLEMYKPFFEAAAEIGANFFVLHGARGRLTVSCEEYAERLWRFSNKAKEFSVCVAHENVVDYAGQSPQFMAYLKSVMGSDFKMVLDIKQARRAKVDCYDFIERLKESIIHIHLSDCDRTHDCLPPGEGVFDFKRLFCTMQRLGFDGKYIIELYSDNFKTDKELKDSFDYLNSII